jgi:hypothetical protein
MADAQLYGSSQIRAESLVEAGYVIAIIDPTSGEVL